MTEEQEEEEEEEQEKEEESGFLGVGYAARLCVIRCALCALCALCAFRCVNSAYAARLCVMQNITCGALVQPHLVHGRISLSTTHYTIDMINLN